MLLILFKNFMINIFRCGVQPDIAAPGVNILASWSPAQSPLQSPDIFKIESGTSMSCPHMSGIVALLKAIHPTWSPAAIKSALVTTGESKFHGITAFKKLSSN